MRASFKLAALFFSSFFLGTYSNAAVDKTAFCAQGGTSIWVLARADVTACWTDYSYNLYECTENGPQFVMSRNIHVWKGGPGCA
jgi:hypothetical protein